MNEDKILRKYDTFVRTFVRKYFISKVRKYESTKVLSYEGTCTRTTTVLIIINIQLLSIFGSMIPSTCTVRVRTCTTTIHWLLFGSTKVLLYLTIYPVCIQCTRTEDFMEILPCLLYTCTRVRRYDRALTKKTKVYADQKAVFHPHLYRQICRYRPDQSDRGFSNQNFESVFSSQ
jgi:hypothetical protein